MKIIANEGMGAFLIEVDPDTHWVFRTLRDVVYQGIPKGSALAHGQWEEWTPGVLDAGIIAAAERAEKIYMNYNPS